METVLITGASGLIGSESAVFFSRKGFRVVGIDNDLRRYFFGGDASTVQNREWLKKNVPHYRHKNIDIRNFHALAKIFRSYGRHIKLIIHAAAQPSHDWAAQEPFVDFSVNANATLNLLELMRRYCPQAVFIFTSTNKVYGDQPNLLPLTELESRWEVASNHPYYDGIDERMSIDASMHSLFGASKLAADILVQEYGRYFQLHTVCFRAGCMTGSRQAATQQHGFLAYLMKCCHREETYTIFGYKGKQVRDNIHSQDLVEAFHEFYKNPKFGAVYNIGGGRSNSCSIQEAIKLCEEITGRKLKSVYSEKNRSGDHIWYITDFRKFKQDYPGWVPQVGLRAILEELHQSLSQEKILRGSLLNG